METIIYRNIYGTHESNGLVNGAAYHQANADNVHPDFPHGVEWTEPGLKITRLRLISDPGYRFWDVSYCDGMIGGKHVDVHLPFSQLPKLAVTATIIAHAKRDGVFAKGIGILDCISKLN